MVMFRNRLRVLTAVWGTVFTLDALAGLVVFHTIYVTKYGLKA